MSIFNIFKKKKDIVIKDEISQLVKDVLKIIEDDEAATGKSKLKRGDFIEYELPFELPNQRLWGKETIRIYVPTGDTDGEIKANGEYFALNDAETKIFRDKIEKKRLEEEQRTLEDFRRKQNLKKCGLKSIMGIPDIKDERKNKLKNIIDK